MLDAAVRYVFHLLLILFTMKINYTLLLILFSFLLHAQDEKGDTQRLPDGVTKPTYQHNYPIGGKVAHPQICPPSWWVGMKNQELELMIHDTEIATLFPSINYKGITIKEAARLANPNYLFITILMMLKTMLSCFLVVFQPPLE